MHPGRIESRIDKLEKAVQAETGGPLVIWITKFFDMTLDDTVENLTRPLATEGTDVRRVPYALNSETKAWILEHWDQIIPEAREVLMEKMEKMSTLEPPREDQKP